MAKKKASETGKSAVKAAKKAKAAQKIERKETKKVGKSKKEDEEDLETILENMRKEWEQAHTVLEEVADGPPSRRANATLTACPSGNYLWCIGGEFFSDDGKAYFYNDVYRYTPEKNEWRKFVSQTCPGPRSAHAVVASPAAGGKLFLFGGEFSSLYQNSFHHYRDFWCFDVGTHTWDRIDTKVRPSARSGCRMVMWKHRWIFLFGGFYDPGIRTNYLNDLWYFDTQEYHWRQIEFREGDRRPSPRSGFSFLPTVDGIVLYGGYCKEYTKGKRPIGIMLDDAWFLNITLLDTSLAPSAPVPKSAKASSSKSAATHPFTVKWERRKKIGYAPGRRVGCTMASWTIRGMGVLFGGVTDEDTNEETLESVYHNDMFGYQLSGNGRWVSLTLRKPKPMGKTGSRKAKQSVAQVPKVRDYNNDGENDLEEGGESSEEDKPWKKAKGPVALPVSTKDTIGGVPETDPDDPLLTIPRGRYNAMLTVLRNTLYIYGGILEMGPREYTLDDFYALPLDRLDRFSCLKPCGIALPQDGDTLESSSDEDEDGSEDDDDDDTENEDYDAEECDEETVVGDDREGDEVGETEGGKRKRKKKKEAIATTKKAEPVEEINSEEEESDLRAQARVLLGTDTAASVARSAEDILSTPLPGEALAVFYARSREYWAGKAHGASDNRGKMLRRDGFALAQDRYAEYKPVLEEVEKILSEAGLDDEEIKKGAAAGPKSQGENRNRR